jgi:hypothetical protein
MSYPDGTYQLNESQELVNATPTSGYWVATTDNPVSWVSGETEDDFEAKVSAEVEKVVREGLENLPATGYVGVWTLGPGKAYVDLARHITDLVEAVSLGKFYRQYSIWDIENEAEIIMEDN